VEIMRTISWARWDPQQRVWRVPFRSYEDLRRRWPEIEAAALRNEPEARRQRQSERKARDDGHAAQVQAERRRRRYPVRADDPPPLDWPVATHGYGVVLFEDIVGEVVDTESVAALYPHLGADVDYVWARWRLPTLEEVNATWPAREPEAPEVAGPRGWWRPSRAELQERRRLLRATERARRTRAEAREEADGSTD
jgi:hypothetical protein